MVALKSPVEAKSPDVVFSPNCVSFTSSGGRCGEARGSGAGASGSTREIKPLSGSGGAFLLRLIALSYAPRIILLYAISAMIEIVIERWTNAEGKTDFRWSVWSDGRRIQMGENVHSRANDCEAQAIEFCWRKLGRRPDRVTRL